MAIGYKSSSTSGREGPKDLVEIFDTANRGPKSNFLDPGRTLLQKICPHKSFKITPAKAQTRNADKQVNDIKAVEANNETNLNSALAAKSDLKTEIGKIRADMQQQVEMAAKNLGIDPNQAVSALMSGPADYSASVAAASIEPLTGSEAAGTATEVVSHITDALSDKKNLSKEEIEAVVAEAQRVAQGQGKSRDIMETGQTQAAPKTPYQYADLSAKEYRQALQMSPDSTREGQELNQAISTFQVARKDNDATETNYDQVNAGDAGKITAARAAGSDTSIYGHDSANLSLLVSSLAQGIKGLKPPGFIPTIKEEIKHALLDYRLEPNMRALAPHLGNDFSFNA